MNFVFGKKNYTWMLIGLGLFIVGLVIMSLDKEPYGFGFLGLTLGPLCIAAGLGIQFYAIMAKTEKTSKS